MRAYRILQTRHLQTAFSGVGAATFPGRWNMSGDRVVYFASSLALAALEILVHIGKPSRLQLYSWYEVEFAEELLHTPNPLPQNWEQMPIPQSARTIGHEWYIANTSAILRVPSAVIPTESNYLLNTRHPDFAGIKIGKPQKFEWDERLKE